ncbi:MAG: nucleoside 2-deoxyribosyltransferase [Ignavibacteria bacterium]|nr:nucleoside 2-deoxyribosyltransferase [Ignavibacteria bacterium]MBT8381224.1 nucleoside 2-deoxyribosyltransferase [Ignavibacteria bacterium]MBT8392114.1 nucleoside 2-deoxyribosyltransferase [Ignavibacteria bacterium]NNJ53901.1 deoxyribonucleoside 5'-monophosphate N-glycosidase [Ignavibacteriaceae bacterium]NNL22644.1 deoxyribonucleoside 5'-monophosphate N-glycosidase [Ignavibacteriaceae bacterium]
MIIYCAGPIRGDVSYQKFYAEVINHIEDEGHSALAEFNGEFSVSVPLTETQIYKRDLKWIDGSKLMIAEISGPSLGVGFEIAYAIFQRKIPVLALVNSNVKNVSAMLTGCNSPLLTISEYDNMDGMKHIISEFINRIN